MSNHKIERCDDFSFSIRRKNVREFLSYLSIRILHLEFYSIDSPHQLSSAVTTYRTISGSFIIPSLIFFSHVLDRKDIYLLSSVTNLRVLHSILRPRLCTTGSALSPARMFANWGKKRSVRVAVVEARIRAVIVTKARVARSGIRLASTTTIPDVITTKYTLIPMYCESFRAGIFTCLKS